MVRYHFSDQVRETAISATRVAGSHAATILLCTVAAYLLAFSVALTTAWAADPASGKPAGTAVSDEEVALAQPRVLSFAQFQEKQAVLRRASQSCVTAITIAEARYGIPKGLLQAIAKVESGRPDPATGRIEPWPWSININNQGMYFQNLEQSVRWVRRMQAQGVTSIDTGCLQVNLRQHPAAFRTLEDAFDPVQNADYAARFLVQLRHETGDWIQAAGLYHSRTPALSDPYRKKVQTALNGAPVTAHDSILDRLKSAWASTLQSRSADTVGAAWTLTSQRVAPVAGTRANGLVARRHSLSKQQVNLAGW